MKNITIIAFCLCLFLNVAKAQTIEVFTSLPYAPSAIATKGNDLYISYFDLSESIGKIVKIDVTETNPIIKEVVTSTFAAKSFAFKGNDLYFATLTKNTSTLGEVPYDIYRVDITETNPVVTDVILELRSISSIAFFDNELYILFREANNISKIDVSETNPTLIEVMELYNGENDIAFYGNELYMSLEFGNSFVKIDITEKTPTIIGITPNGDNLKPTTTLAIKNNELYFGQSFYGNKISKIDITSASPTLVDIIEVDNKPSKIVFHGDDLYMISDNETEVLKISLLSLSIDDIAPEMISEAEFKLYPNPAGDFIGVTGLKTLQYYTIYQVNGTVVKTGQISDNNKIDISNLTSGLYFITLENGITSRFIKH